MSQFPVFRIGWVAGGSHTPDKNSAFAVNEHIIHQFPMQLLALVDYLDTSI